MEAKKWITLSITILFLLILVGSLLGLIRDWAERKEPALPPLATRTQETPLEAAKPVEGIYSIIDPDFGVLVSFGGFTFQCAKVEGPAYIDYYKFGIVYMGPIEYGKPEWESLTDGQKEAIKAECDLQSRMEKSEEAIRKMDG